MAKIIGDNKVHEDALVQMRERGGRWYAYQNHALDSASCGELRFLKVGAGCTYEAPPDRYPDGLTPVAWAYVPVGEVDLATGEVKEP